METTHDIVAKLWSLCHVLRDDGITYNEYVTELTYLLFLKMLAETERENRLPTGYRWGELARREGLDQLDHYKRMLLDLGDAKKVSDPLVQAIFTDAQTRLRKPTNLKALTTSIDKLDWFSAREEGLGNLYEGLLEKNAAEKKSGAGQYFTPRPLIDCIVRLMKPQPGEVVQDPAAGTGGFLVAADHHIKQQTDDLFALAEAQAFFQRHNAFVGAELVTDTHRLCMMNLMLHGIEGGVSHVDTLSPDSETLGKADVVLTNPPFGTKKGGGRPTRSDFSITADTSNKQLAFVEHIVRALKPGGRAAVVVPDNVLFEDNTGRRLRTWVMDLCDLHTILRLPTGIFYAQGVKTNVLFLSRGRTDKGNTKAVWVYDMRANMTPFGKTRPLTVADFAEFEACFGDDPFGKAKRKDQGEPSRFRCFTREQIAAWNDNLDITWLRDTETDSEEQLTEPEDIAAAIIGHFKVALEDTEALADEIDDEVVLRALGSDRTLREVCISISDGDHQAPPKATVGIPFITISALNDGFLRLDKASRYVPESYYRDLKPNRIAKSGDVLFSVTGSIGLTALVETDEPFVFQRHIAILKPNPEKVLSKYLLHALRSQDIKDQM